MERIKKIRKKQKENQGKKLIKLAISSKIQEYVTMLQNNMKNNQVPVKQINTDEIKYNDALFNIIQSKPISKLNKKNQKKLNLATNFI